MTNERFRFPLPVVAPLALAPFLAATAFAQLGPQVRAPRPVERSENRPPVVSTSLTDAPGIEVNDPFLLVLPTPFRSGDQLLFFVRVTDPDGDAVSLEIEHPFGGLGLRLDHVGGTPSDAFYQVRVGLPYVYNPFLGDHRLVPERLEFEARDSGSPPASTTFVQDIRNRRSGTVVAVGDVTGDGTPDFLQRVFGVGSPDILVFAGENLGDPPTQLALHHTYAGIRLRDLTGDGILDVACVRSGSSTVADLSVFPGGPHLASGAPQLVRLAAGLTASTSYPASVEFADVTGDGVFDVVLGGEFGFAVWAGPIPDDDPLPPATVLAPHTHRTSAPFLEDVTGDGILDLLVAAPDQVDGQGICCLGGRILFYPGGPALDSEPASTLVDLQGTMGDDLGTEIRVADLTGDGNLDVVASAPGFTVGISHVSRFFVWAGPLPAGTVDATVRLSCSNPSQFFAPEIWRIADVTGDGVFDLLTRGNDILVFEGGAGLAGEVVERARFDLFNATLIDVNGDLVPDLWDGGDFWAGGPTLVGSPAPFATLESGAGSWARGDVTGDGILDFVAETAGGIVVYEGPVSFSGTVSPSATLGGRDLVDLRDVTGDGILDVVGHDRAATVDGVVEAGAGYVWHGGPGIAGATPPTATLTRAQPNEEERFGFGDQWFEDIDDDGILDIVFSEPGIDGSTPNQGEQAVFLGGPALVGHVLPSAALSAEDEYDPVLTAVFDLTGDDRPELITDHLQAPSNDDAISVWLDPASNPALPILLIL